MHGTQGCPLTSTYADTHIHIKPHMYACTERQGGEERDSGRERGESRKTVVLVLERPTTEDLLMPSVSMAECSLCVPQHCGLCVIKTIILGDRQRSAGSATL